MDVHPTAPLLETDRLGLRRLTEADVDRLTELDSDPEVMRHISLGRPTPRDVIEREHLPRMRSWSDRDPRIGFWAAEERGTGEFAGWFHLRPDVFEAGAMELGYRLKRRFWGHGLATEMGGELVRRAREEWGFRRVTGRTLIVNSASRRVLEKCGLRFEAEFTYPEAMLPGTTGLERRGVLYALQSS